MTYSAYYQTTNNAPKLLVTGTTKREAYAKLISVVRGSKTPKASILKHRQSYIALVSFK